MRLLLSLICLLFLAGCEPSEEERYRECAALLEQGEYVLDVISTETWRIGQLPFWATPKELRAVLRVPIEAEVPIAGMQWVRYDQPRASFTILGDTLAYPSFFDLLSDSLVTDRGVFSSGTSSSRMRAAFPRSYRCRNFALNEHGDLYDTQVLLADTVREAQIALWFQDGGLVAVGEYWHRPVQELWRAHWSHSAAQVQPED